MKRPSCASGERRGVAAVEFAFVLPFLLLMLVAAVDFARAYYYTQVVAACARTGALYASNSDLADLSPYETVEQAALSEAAGLTPQPTVTVTPGVNALGNSTVQVTASYPFTLASGLIGGAPLTLSRSATARVYPVTVETP